MVRPSLCSILLLGALVAPSMSAIASSSSSSTSKNVQSVNSKQRPNPVSASSLLNQLLSSAVAMSRPAVGVTSGALSGSSAGSGDKNSNSNGSSSSGSSVLANLPLNIGRPVSMPSFQSLLDITGLHRLTDPMLNEARKRWDRIRTSQLLKRVLGQLSQQRRKFHY